MLLIIVEMATQKDYYVISGYADDAHIFRHGSRIVDLHKAEAKITGGTFWDLSGSSYRDTKWFLAIGRGDRIIGTCMVSPEKNSYILSNMVAVNLEIERDLLRKARGYSNNMPLISYIDNDIMKQKLKNLGALESSDPAGTGTVERIKMIFPPSTRISNRC